MVNLLDIFSGGDEMTKAAASVFLDNNEHFGNEVNRYSRFELFHIYCHSS